jgi:hypothetical protein
MPIHESPSRSTLQRHSLRNCRFANHTWAAHNQGTVSGTRLRRLLLRSAVNEAGDVGLELGEILVAQIHHVSRVVILQVDILL